MLQVRTGIHTLGSPIITGLTRTSDICSNLFVYGSLLPVETQISTLPDDYSLTLTKNAIGTGSAVIEITTAQPGVYLDRVNTLADIKNIMDERGNLLKIEIRTEVAAAPEVVRDDYNSIKRRKPVIAPNEPLFFRTFPVHYQPSEKQLEKAGIREQANVIAYTSMADWIAAGYNFSDINLNGKFTCILDGEIWELKDKGRYGQVADTHSYITLGLFKR